MNTAIINIDRKPDRELIGKIEEVKGWFIEWGDGYVKLSADTEDRLKELEAFFRKSTNL